MWSRKPIPVAIDDAPVPSRSTPTSIWVSLVARLTEPLRMNGVAFLEPPAFYQATFRDATSALPARSANRRRGGLLEEPRR